MTEGDAGINVESSKDGWLVGEELRKTMSDSGAEEKWEQRWPFRVSSGAQDWEGRAYVLFVSHLTYFVRRCIELI